MYTLPLTAPHLLKQNLVLAYSQPFCLNQESAAASSADIFFPPPSHPPMSIQNRAPLCVYTGVIYSCGEKAGADVTSR